MKKTSDKHLDCIFSFASFVLSCGFIFSPLHKSENIIISLAVAFMTGFPCLILILKLFEKEKTCAIKSKAIYGIISIVTCSFSTIISLILVTEIIKDVAYIANRNISSFYYISLAIAVLAASYYLCTNHESGMYRFCILSCFVFIFLSIMIFTAFLSTKSIVTDAIFIKKVFVPSAIIKGIITGLFFTLDSTAFLICFPKFTRNNNGTLTKKPIIIGYLYAFLLVFFYNISTALIFGTELTKVISDPDYALVKLLPGMDFTEIISAIRIISFMIKSSIYVFASSKVISNFFGKEKAISAFMLSQYIFIPVVVIVLTLIDTNLEYGAFQHLIYILTAVFSILLTLTALLCKKRE